MKWKMVPVEPTEEMLRAAESVVLRGSIDLAHVDDRIVRDGAWTLGSFDDTVDIEYGVQGRVTGSRRVYRAMLAAAPEPGPDEVIVAPTRGEPSMAVWTGTQWKWVPLPAPDATQCLDGEGV